MRKNLFTLLLSILFYSMPVSQGALATTETSRSTSTSVSAEELKSFILRNSSPGQASSGEEYLTAFFTPFKPDFSRLSRLDQVKAKRNAFNSLGKVVALAYLAFDTNLREFRAPDGPISDQLTHRRFIQGYYKRTLSPYFLTFQRLTAELIRLNAAINSEANFMLSSDYVVNPTYEIAWLKDRNGIVPIPLSKRLQDLPIYYGSVIYGSWEDDLQRALVFKQGQLVLSSGLYISTQDNITFKFILQNGVAGQFKTSPITARVLFTNPIIPAIKAHIDFPTTKNAFISFPETAAEEAEFEAAFLEEMVNETRVGDNPFAIDFLRYYFLEDVRPESVMDSEEVVISEDDTSEAFISTVVSEPSVSTDTIVSTHIASLYSPQVSEALSVHDQEDGKFDTSDKKATRKKSSGKKAKATDRKSQSRKVTPSGMGSSGGGAAGAPAVTDEATLRRETLKERIVSQLKERGREKWRTLVKVLNTALKEAYKANRLGVKVNTDGSHLNLHLISASGETSDGITIVKAHGSDPTLAAGEARNLARKLIDLTFNLITK